jgi:hypothetical protein
MRGTRVVLLRHGRRDRRRTLLDHADLRHEGHHLGGLAGERDGVLLELAVNERRVTTAVEEMNFDERAVHVHRLVVEDDLLVAKSLTKNCFQFDVTYLNKLGHR